MLHLYNGTQDGSRHRQSYCVPPLPPSLPPFPQRGVAVLVLQQIRPAAPAGVFVVSEGTDEAVLLDASMNTGRGSWRATWQAMEHIMLLLLVVLSVEPDVLAHAV